jgi:hypothetical protein
MKLLTVPLLALGLTLAGCGPSLLRDYRDAEMRLVEDGPSAYSLELHVAQYQPPCRPPFSGAVHATFNGTIQVLPSTYEPTYVFGDREYCTDPSFAVPDVGPGDVEIVIDDGREQFRMKILSAFASRTWVMDPVDSTTLTMGQQVTLKWLPQTDVLSSDTAEVVFLDDTSTYVWGADPVRPDAATFQFTVPTATPGTGTLAINVAADPAITECSGPAACAGAPFYSATRQVTVQ